MKKLILVVFSILLPVSVSAEQLPVNFVTVYANSFNLDPKLLVAICKVESNCKPQKINYNDGTSKQKSLHIKSGSYGLFQIKLETAKTLGFKGTRKDLLKPEVNAYYAAKLLDKLYKRYGSITKVLSAYNAGRYVSYNFTYVNKVLLWYSSLKLDRR